MSTFKVRGIVIKTIDAGECDKIVILLVKEKGKITIFAKGAKKAKSKFLVGTEIFTYGDYIIYDGGKFSALSQVDIIENFYGVRNNYEMYCAGSFFCELCEKVILENLECNDILYLLLKTINVMAKEKIQPSLAICIFIFKFFQYNGYSPQMDRCCVCTSVEGCCFFGHDGVVCDQCISVNESVVRIKSGAIKGIQYILESNIDNLYMFSVTKDVLENIRVSADLFMDYHLDVRIKSREFL